MSEPKIRDSYRLADPTKTCQYCEHHFIQMHETICNLMQQAGEGSSVSKQGACDHWKQLRQRHTPT